MILLDTRRIQAYERLLKIGEAIGKEEDDLNELWGEFLQNEELMATFIYYLDHHTLYDGIRCEGYGLTDLYFYNMRRTEMRQDIGKNYGDSDKDALALETFSMMAKMMKAPEEYVKKLEHGLGMDTMM